ncbi:type II toxin-antitoxin system RelE/ParE family toxin [Azospirillum sp. sgz301742]
MGRLRFAREARADLKSITAHIGADSPVAASRLAERLLRKCSLLAERPTLGRPRHELKPGLRSTPVDRYVIFYWPAEDGIIVARVLHSALDISKAFGE